MYRDPHLTVFHAAFIETFEMDAFEILEVVEILKKSAETRKDAYFHKSDLGDGYVLVDASCGLQGLTLEIDKNLYDSYIDD
jgi:hypothetical protein